MVIPYGRLAAQLPYHMLQFYDEHDEHSYTGLTKGQPNSTGRTTELYWVMDARKMMGRIPQDAHEWHAHL